MDPAMMAQRNDREYTNYLRTQRDSPSLQNKEKSILSRGYVYSIQTPNGRQFIPAYQIPKYDEIYIHKSPYATITPKERAFILQRQIQKNTIRLLTHQRLSRSGDFLHNEFIQHYQEQNRQLADQLKDVVY